MVAHADHVFHERLIFWEVEIIAAWPPVIPLR